MNTKVELLAPAGSMEQLAAAVENGADAVYLGGKAFNARINANNFTDEQLERAVSYAHLRNVNVYLTLNILIEDAELLPALRYVETLYNIGIDGIIIQDLGLAALIREYIPDLPLHLSTQGTVYNRSGVGIAKELGFSRVVIARETSLSEIRQITEAQLCDIEVFIHGALCMCYSGQCQMSRLLGGRSGNRGLCAQPCRLAYENSNRELGYWLSPKDLCLIDHLGDLAEAGVRSLKIEGRMKSPEYVAVVVGIYRKYLDLYQAHGEYTVSAEDRKALEQIFNRGGFASGYLFGNDPELLSGDLSKHKGVYVGRVVALPKEQALIDIMPSAEIEMGDGVEVHANKITGNVITYLKPINKENLRIGDIKGRVEPGDPVYRITSAALMRKARQSYDKGGPDGNEHNRKIQIEMEIWMETGQPARLLVREGETQIEVLDHEAIPEKARNKPITEAMVSQRLKKTGGTPFEVITAICHIEAGCTLSVSALNRIRRTALASFAVKKLSKARAPVKLPKQLSFSKPVSEKSLAFYFLDGSLAANYNFDGILTALEINKARAYVPLQYFMNHQLQRQNIQFVPYILNISKGKLDHYIEQNFSEIVMRVKASGIAIGNLGWMSEFMRAGVTVYGDYGLNLNNWKSVDTIEELGVIPVAFSHETDVNGTEGIPLMITEHLVNSRFLMDRKKIKHKVYRDVNSEKTLIISGKTNRRSMRNDWEMAQGELRIYIT